MIIRLPLADATTETIVNQLSKLTDEKCSWLTWNTITSKSWSVKIHAPTNEWGDLLLEHAHYKIWVKEPKLATLLLLYI